MKGKGWPAVYRWQISKRKVVRRRTTAREALISPARVGYVDHGSQIGFLSSVSPAYTLEFPSPIRCSLTFSKLFTRGFLTLHAMSTSWIRDRAEICGEKMRHRDRPKYVVKKCFNVIEYYYYVFCQIKNF